MSPSFILESIRAFLSTKPLLTESVSWAYKIPKDRETQLFDLYLLLSFKQIMDNPKMMERGLTKPGWDENTIKDLEAIVDDGLKVLVDHMTKDYLKAGAVAIASEIRHVFDSGEMTASKLKSTLDKGEYNNFTKYWRDFSKYKAVINDKRFSRRKDKEWLRVGKSENYSAAYKAFLASEIGLNALCELGKKLFPMDVWRSSYGGKNWAKIAKEIKALNNAKGTNNKALTLDRVIDLVHNTGLMIDKSAAFAKDGGYEWLKKALDFKKKASAWQMAEKSSFPEAVIGKLIRLTDLGGTKENELGGAKTPAKQHKDDTKSPESKKHYTPETKPNPETWHKHSNGGGWVKNTTTVAETAYVGPDARVFDYARVYDNAQIYGSAMVYGHAHVYEEAWVYEQAKVFDTAWVHGDAKVYGKAKVHGFANIGGQSKVFGSADVYGNAKVAGRDRVTGELNGGPKEAPPDTEDSNTNKPPSSSAFKPSIKDPTPDPKTWHKHPNGGGWVENTASVDSTAYVYKDAMVYGKAQVQDKAEIHDDARVYEDALVHDYASVLHHGRVFGAATVDNVAIIADRAMVYGSASVYGDAYVGDDAKVFEGAAVRDHASVKFHAMVYGDALISDHAQVLDYAIVHGKAKIKGSATVQDAAEVVDAVVKDEAKITGSAKVKGENTVISGISVIAAAVNHSVDTKVISGNKTQAQNSASHTIEDVQKKWDAAFNDSMKDLSKKSYVSIDTNGHFVKSTSVQNFLDKLGLGESQPDIDLHNKWSRRNKILTLIMLKGEEMHIDAVSEDITDKQARMAAVIIDIHKPKNIQATPSVQKKIDRYLKKPIAGTDA